MRSTVGLCTVLALALTSGVASGSATPDLLHSATRLAPLTPAVTYQASLFAPQLRVTPRDATWQGAQFTSHGYDWVALVQRPPNAGGVVLVAAPGSRQSAATTLHRLETERADIPAVGISTQPAVPVTIAGFTGQQFDGVVTGQYGHTFVPFSGHSRGASSSAGDHLRIPEGKAFRIVVLNVRGSVVFVEIDENSPTLDSSFLGEVTDLLSVLRFPAS